MDKIQNSKDTIAALATGLGSGSIAVIRVSGSRAIAVVNSIFSGKNLSQVAGNTTHFGRIVSNGIEIDQAVVSVFRNPNSYTGEDLVEISCHANHFIVNDILNALFAENIRTAAPGEFTFRAFLNGKIDLSQAESVADLISTRSRLGVKNSLFHLEGKLSQTVLGYKDQIIELISLLELDIDFSEEDLDIVSKETICGKLNNLIGLIEKRSATFNQAKLLSGNIDIVIIGKPNVGKSSLLNVLLGENRAIVSEAPGTTRDFLRDSILIDDTLFNIVDTAGIRNTHDEIESEGIQHARQQVINADILITLFDISKELDEDDREILNSIVSDKQARTIVAGNKCDLGKNEQTLNYLRSLGLNPHFVSAKHQQGIAEMKKEITLILKNNQHLIEDEVIITNLRQKNLLDKTLVSLRAAHKAVSENMGNEFVVVDLRNALDALGQILGETTPDDILNNIFSGFCIGK